ncbi:MAG: mechanosensitive ion channel family protein [Gemmataceae bacterium]|nr:mechanosensitive ion channel family protein [Gemmataceae bacterium]
MELFAAIIDFLDEDRLLANLIGVHVILGIILVLSIVIRKILLRGGDSLVRWTGMHWLDQVGQEANRRVRALMFWTTLLTLSISVASGVVYHAAGRDIRADLGAWHQHLTGAHLIALGFVLGKLTLLLVAVHIAFGLVRRGMHFVETYTLHLLQVTSAAAAPETSGSKVEPSQVGPASAAPVDDERSQQETAQRWFFLLERFALASVLLGGLYMASRILEWPVLDTVVVFLWRFLTIVMVARLATLACKTVLHLTTRLGDRHLDGIHARRYWERVTRLFPFGRKCFEAAVYVYAATKCVALFRHIDMVENYGGYFVKCVGVFFITRMLIELLQTLISEAFGVFEEDRPIDQKSLTLAPLLQSIVQYVLYFASAIVMLEVCNIPTEPFLAAAGIVGLAAGLGAQSMVTDLVSGFFILFENQYLVGDVVQIGDAHGRVEAVSIRTTQIRDENGKLFIIPNGQVKNVVNYSKGYINAVVDFQAPTSANLEHLTADMAEAGRRLRRQRREVLAETVVKGPVDLTPGNMVIRALTKVQPGTHQAMQIEYRRLLKQVLDERQTPAKAAA